MPQDRAPLQNRVDPFGALHAVRERGMFMGNRGGRFHTNDRRIGRRTHVSRRWICCLCAFANRHRTVWGAGYTELFFLDEVTALTAGHRPCFECRRCDARAFQAHFSFGADEKPGADAMDRRLHGERLAQGDGGALSRRTFRMDTRDVPDGAMCVADAEPFAIFGNRLLPWSFDGYGAPVGMPDGGHLDVLTPPSIVHVLRNGYRPHWHASAHAQALTKI